MWQRLTKEARLSVYNAQEAAQQYSQKFITPDLLMLGLLKDRDWKATAIVEQLGLSHEALIAAITARQVMGAAPDGKFELSAEAKKCIDCAYIISRQFKHTWIGTEHLLAGILMEAERHADARGYDACLTLARVKSAIATFGEVVWPPAPTTNGLPNSDGVLTPGNDIALIATVLALVSTAVSLSYLTPAHAPIPWFQTHFVLLTLNAGAVVCAYQARKSPQSGLAMKAVVIATVHSFVLWCSHIPMR